MPAYALTAKKTAGGLGWKQKDDLQERDRVPVWVLFPRRAIMSLTGIFSHTRRDRVVFGDLRLSDLPEEGLQIKLR